MRRLSEYDLDNNHKTRITIRTAQLILKAVEQLRICFYNNVLLTRSILLFFSSCIDNCGSKVLLKKPIILSVKDSPANTTNVTVDYNWKIALSRHHHVTRRAAVTENKKFVISPTDLQPNQTYVVSLEAEVNKTMIKSEYSFRTDDVPVGGRCEISPPSGKVIETSFQIKCSNWEDQDSPLWYEYFYNDVSSGSLLMAYGWQSYSPPLYLPPGDPSSNFTLNVRVDIVDTLGSRRQVPLTVQVRKLFSLVE